MVLDIDETRSGGHTRIRSISEVKHVLIAGTRKIHLDRTKPWRADLELRLRVHSASICHPGLTG